MTLETPMPTSLNSEWNFQLQRIPDIAQTDFPTLILGESGVGKEVVAQRIHKMSQRSKHPLITINCGALSESLIESELFGHIRGSYTGASENRKGAFEAARKGTLFLDEIGELPMSLQPKLLRVLENQELRPVGSDRTVRTNVRIIAATHRPLHEAVARQTFRADLYYRLNVIKVSVPSLRQRMEDFESFLYQFAREYRVRFSHAAISKLKEYAWPGNIRELKNFVARISAQFPNNHIQPEHIKMLFNDPGVEDDPESPPSIEDILKREEPLTLKEMERDLIIQRLTINMGNQRKTAHELGIPKSTLHDRIRRHGINPELFL